MLERNSLCNRLEWGERERERARQGETEDARSCRAGAGTPGTPVFTKRRVFLSLSSLFGFSLLWLIVARAPVVTMAPTQCDSMHVQVDNIQGVP